MSLAATRDLTSDVVIDALIKKAQSMQAEGKYEASIKLFDRVLAQDPSNSNAYFNKGLSLQKVGQHDKAIRCYNQTITLRPRHISAYYNKGILDLQSPMPDLSLLIDNRRIRL